MVSELHLPTATHIGGVSLRVSSLAAARDFYGGLLGMESRSRSDGRETFGAPNGQHALVELVEMKGALTQPIRAAGLYHTAFLLPSRSGLGHMLRKLAESEWPLTGASDHLVSEALYLDDPDGNGVEIYADRPRESWRRENGSIAMATEHLDLRSLLAASDRETAAGFEWRGFPEGSVVGHVHLRVPSIEAARVFFVDSIGMDITASGYPGALFMSAGGYHHHVAANIWQGRNVPPLPANAAGLLHFEIIVPEESTIAWIAANADKAGLVVTQDGGAGISIEGAGGIMVKVRPRSTL